jgi:hypothetical protein
MERDRPAATEFIAGDGKEVARPKGFEPLTPRFVVWCSIQLSYGRAMREALPCREAFS